MVSGDEVDAMGRLQPSDRLGVVAELGHGALGQVPGDGDQVGSQAVRSFHYSLQPTPSMDQVQVNVRKVKDGEAVQLPGELR